MSFNVRRNLGIAHQNNIFAPKTSDIVTGDELTNIAKEILSSAPGRSAQAGTPFTKLNTKTYTELKLADVDISKQAAVNKTGYDITLSQNAFNAINGLKALAAQVQIANPSKAVDGKIGINSEKINFSDRTASSLATQAQIINPSKAVDGKIGINSDFFNKTASFLAAQAQIINPSKLVDGKIHINSEKIDFSERKSSFLIESSKNLEIFSSQNLDKDKKGSGGFYVPLRNDEKESQEQGFNVVI